MSETKKPTGPAPFSWFAEGKLDYLLGKTFSESKAPDLFAREEWEAGWLSAQKLFPSFNGRGVHGRPADVHLRVSATTRLPEI